MDVAFGSQSEDLANAFLAMGARVSFTCAPYQLASAPRLGEQVAFGESNVVCYANSVLGARTVKYPNMLEALIALTGRAPLAGIHLHENRVPKVCISVPSLAHLGKTALDDSFWPLLGYTVGAKAGSHIPLIIGLQSLTTPPSRDALKAFSAAFATSAGAPMFHMMGVTPEAAEYCDAGARICQMSLTWRDLHHTWSTFNQEARAHTVDLVSLGNPHFSLAEMRNLTQLVHGRSKHPRTSVIVTTSRSQHALAMQAGYVAALEAFGVQILTDTCWCFIREPVIRTDVKCIMTNSGKYAHYGPGLTGREFCFGGLGDCIKGACTGQWDSATPVWIWDGMKREEDATVLPHP